jgi:UDP-glucose 4-epimerase
MSFPTCPARFVVTGGAGFIGSHLTEALLRRSHHVTVIDNLSTGSIANLRQARRYSSTFTFIRADVRDGAVLEQAIGEGDTVLHLAATVGVKKVCLLPDQTWSNNFHSTEKLLSVVSRRQGRLFLASTSEVYGEAGRRALDEEDAAMVYSQLGGRSAYTLGKLMSEHICLTAYQQYGLPTMVGRLFNTSGPRQQGTYGMVLPTFIRQASSAEPLTIFGDGAQTRCFADVRDTVAAMLSLLECPAAWGELVNIGHPEEVSIRDLAGLVVDRSGSRSPIIHLPMPPERAGRRDVTHRRPDVSKLRALTGWEPRYGLVDTIDRMLSRVRRGIGLPQPI